MGDSINEQVFCTNFSDGSKYYMCKATPPRGVWGMLPQESFENLGFFWFRVPEHAQN